MKKVLMLALFLCSWCTASELSFTVQTALPCEGASNGIITITVTGGIAPYTVSVGADSREGQLPDDPIPFGGLAAGDYIVSVSDSSFPPITEIREVSLAESDLVVTVVSSPFNCKPSEGGTIFVRATGSNVPYSYSIVSVEPPVESDATGFLFTDLVPSDYIVLVSDSNGCTITERTTVGASIGLTVESIVPANCFSTENGSVTVTVTQARAPFRFSIDGGTLSDPQDDPSFTFENVPPGEHMIRVEDSSVPVCSRIITVEVPTFALTAIATRSSCSSEGAHDGTITATVSGGTGPYVFSLNGDASEPQDAPEIIYDGLAAGIYLVAVEDDQGCSADQMLEVLASTLDLMVTATPSSCSFEGADDGTIMAVASGGELPYVFSLNGEASEPQDDHEITYEGLAAGDYTVAVEDGLGCTVTRSINVAPSDLMIAIKTTPQRFETGTDGSITVIISGGQAPYTVQVDGQTMSGQTVTFSDLVLGDYIVMVTDAFGCRKQECITVLSDNELRNCTFVKYCSEC